VKQKERLLKVTNTNSGGAGTGKTILAVEKAKG